MGKKSIQIRGLVKDYGGTRVLHGVSFEVAGGTIHGFLGPNGAGKSTTINIVTGLIAPTAGEVLLEGRPRMGLLPENLPLYLNMRVDDYLRFCRDIYAIGERGALPRMGDILEKCGLTEVSRRLIGNLSKGYRQRVGIAQALVAGPEIVILDEPMSGLDPAAVVEMRELILQLGGEHTVLLSSHRLQEVGVMCSHLTIIKEGRIVRTGAWEKMRKDFAGGKRLTLHLTVWKKEWEAVLAERWGIEDIHVECLLDGVRVRMSVPSGEDLRASLSHFVVGQGCGLLEIVEDAPELEDVFQLVTQGNPENFSEVSL